VNGAQPIFVTLSLEELLVVLNTLEATSIPGLVADEWTRLSPAEQDLALSVARRALEARGLAATDPSGAVLVHRTLLKAVGVCAYPQRTLLIEHWAAGGQPENVFVHARDEDRVVHTVAGGLHTFALHSSHSALVDHLGALCGWSGAAVAPNLALTIPRADFTRVCDAAAAGAETEAMEVVAAATKSGAAGSALVRALSGTPRISIVQVLSGPDGQPSDQPSFTVIGGAEGSWVVAPTDNDDGSPLRAQTTSRGELGSTLLRGL